MNNNKQGRPVDISNINLMEIEIWMKSNKSNNNILLCQSIIALSKGVSMTEVCHVMGVTRETIRLWKDKLRKGGLSEVLAKRKLGKRSKLTAEKEKELRGVLKKHPEKFGYPDKKWTGRLICTYAQDHWKYTISLRTAQLWLAMVV
jgi:transposase